MLTAYLNACFFSCSNHFLFQLFSQMATPAISSPDEDFYAILGVAKNSSEQDIKVGL